MNPLFLLVYPTVAAVMALIGDRLAYKLSVPGCCALAVSFLFIARPARVPRREIVSMVAGLLLSLVGDYFLATRSGHPHHFEAGIASFLLAHLCFLRYALWNGRIHLLTLAVTLLMFVPYYGLALIPRTPDAVLRVAVLLYLLVSCVGFAAAMGMQVAAPGRWFYRIGIGSLVFSDTLISFSEFLHYRLLNRLILPTYYLCLLGITASILIRQRGREAGDAEPHS